MNHQDYMTLALKEAEFSRDRSRKTGALVVAADGTVLCRGWNELPRGCADVDERRERPAKYQWTEHAERNAIYAAARFGGQGLDGATIYVPWYPCADCARAIIQSGIRCLVAFEPDFADPRWGADFRTVRQMLGEAGVAEVILVGKGPGAAK